MKHVMLICSLMIFGIVFTGCHHDDPVKPAVSWGIDASQMEKATLATGSVDMQNNGPKATFDVKTAYITKLSEVNLYQVTFKFTSTDSLMLVIAKYTNDYNYHFPAAASENQLLYVVFDRDTLELSESAIAIQPQIISNTFSTVTNVHTTDHGDFNGTVNNVVLIWP